MPMTRFDHAADAPEVNHTSLASGCYREDDVAPQVAFGKEPQVFYDSSPPEAVPINVPENVASPNTNDATTTLKPRRKRKILIIAIVVLAIALGLGLGLGLGLRQRGKPDANATATVSTDSGPTVAATQRVKQHGIVNNTSLTAMALRNGQRFVYFQEATGAFRRATFAATTKAWEGSTDSRLASNAKNNTPLAGIVYPDADITLFYLDQANTIDCIEFSLSGPFNGGCSIRENSVNFPSNAVAPDTIQISATMLMPANVPPGLLLVYEEPSGKISMILGYMNGAQNTLWSWVNVTDKFDALLSTSKAGNPEGSVAAACNAGWAAGDPSTDILYLSCFVNKSPDPASSYIDYLINFRIVVNGTLPGNFTVDIGSVDSSPGRIRASSNIAGIGSVQKDTRFGDSQVYFNSSTFETSFGESLPDPRSKFPFQRLASTFASGTGSSYLYHQLSDLAIAEDVWDGGTSGFWVSNNFTISTTIVGQNGLEEPMGDTQPT